MQGPFTPGATAAAINLAAASQSVSVTAAATALEIQHNGTAVAFVRVGTGAQTAVATDYPILPGQSKIITKPVGADTFAAIATAGAGTLYVTSGEGY